MTALNSDTLVQKLREEGFDCAELNAEDCPPEGGVAVTIGSDRHDKARILTIQLRPQWFSSPNPDTQHVMLDMRAQYAFEARDDSVIEVARYVAFLNRLAEVPGFSFDEIDRSVGFRLVQVQAQQNPDWRMLQALVGAIAMQMQMQEQILEELSSGKQTMNTLLEEWVTALT